MKYTIPVLPPTRPSAPNNGCFNRRRKGQDGGSQMLRINSGVITFDFLIYSKTQLDSTTPCVVVMTNFRLCSSLQEQSEAGVCGLQCAPLCSATVPTRKRKHRSVSGWKQLLQDCSLRSGPLGSGSTEHSMALASLSAV